MLRHRPKDVHFCLIQNWTQLSPFTCRKEQQHSAADQAGNNSATLQLSKLCDSLFEGLRSTRLEVQSSSICSILFCSVQFSSVQSIGRQSELLVKPDLSFPILLNYQSASQETATTITGHSSAINHRGGAKEAAVCSLRQRLALWRKRPLMSNFNEQQSVLASKPSEDSSESDAMEMEMEVWARLTQSPDTSTRS